MIKHNNFSYKNGNVEQDLFTNPEFSVSLVSNPQNEEQTWESIGGRGGRTKYMDVELALRNFKVISFDIILIKCYIKYACDVARFS